MSWRRGRGIGSPGRSAAFRRRTVLRLDSRGRRRSGSPSGSRRSPPRRRPRPAFAGLVAARPPSRRRRSSRCRWPATASSCRSSGRGRRRRAAGRSGRRGRTRSLPPNQRPRLPPLLMQWPAVMTTLGVARAHRGAGAAAVAEDAEGEEDRPVDAELGGGRIGHLFEVRAERVRPAPRSAAACRDPPWPPPERTCGPGRLSSSGFAARIRATVQKSLASWAEVGSTQTPLRAAALQAEIAAKIRNAASAAAATAR